MSGTVTVDLGARPLPEAVRELSRQCDLTLSVGPGLQDQKVTVYFRKLPLAEAARALAAATDGVWRPCSSRMKSKAMLEYRLEASPRRLARLQEYRAARRAAEAQRDRVALQALLANLTGRNPPPGSRNADAPANIGLDDYPEPLFPLVRALPSGALQQLVRDANESFRSVGGAGPDPTPVLVVPGATLAPVQRSLLADFLTKLAAQLAKEDGTTSNRTVTCLKLAEHPEMVQLQLWAGRFTDPVKGMQVEMYLRLAAPDAGWGQDLALGDSPYTPLPRAADEARDLAPQGVEFQDPREKSIQIDLKYGTARMDRGLIEIARAAGINIAADYFTKPGVLLLSGSQRSLQSELEEVEKLYNLSHYWLGSTLVVRSRDWPLACDAEPPSAVVDRWEERKRLRADLTLDDYTEAAKALDDVRIATLFTHTDEQGRRLFQLEVPRLARYRHVLRGFAALSGPQRTQACRGNGLPLDALSNQQRERWRPVLQRYLLSSPDWLRSARLLVIPPNSAVGQLTPLPKFLLVGLPEIENLQLVAE